MRLLIVYVLTVTGKSFIASCYTSSSLETNLYKLSPFFELHFGSESYTNIQAFDIYYAVIFLTAIHYRSLYFNHVRMLH